MAKNIHLKCGIKNCHHGHEYIYSSIGPIAITGQFRDEQSKGGNWGGLLPNKPEIGRLYELTLYGPLKIDLDDNFWVLYLDPYSLHEGIGGETDFENSFAFCLCKQVEIIEVQESCIRLTISVIEIHDLQELLAYPYPNYGYSSILDDEAISRDHYHIENLKHYSLITINIQSDIGWNYIVAKKTTRVSLLLKTLGIFMRIPGSCCMKSLR
ncbi:hypothetical protein [Paraflavitalea speifideaquila]|uniref:hypothetical protein n=1 Tax=Paraflavitalea speifideaquila TaxID=3076558 RepID=UPI0028E98E4C|nr:hypothetical protein [Paraflavitalea speifideiaquila]